MRKVRFIGYSVAAASVLVTLIPFPFQIPQIVRDLYTSPLDILIITIACLFLFVSVTVLLTFLIYDVIKRKAALRPILSEFLFVSFLLSLVIISFASPYRIEPSERIYEINKDKAPEQFVNPYVTFYMFDCRSFSTEYDVVFIPDGLRIETDFLAYAPRRKNKTVGYRWGRKYGDDWYWDTTGSQWDPDLIECMNNRLPPGSNG